MFGLLIGSLFGGVIGYIAGSSSSTSSGTSSSTVSAKVSQWSGKLGPFAFLVERNGPTWAWRITGHQASGAEMTATAAINAACLYIVEHLQNPQDSNTTLDGLKLSRGDGKVDATVVHAGENVWHWGILSTDNFAKLPEGPLGNADTLGRAIVALIQALPEYTTQRVPG